MLIPERKRKPVIITQARVKRLACSDERLNECSAGLVRGCATCANQNKNIPRKYTPAIFCYSQMRVRIVTYQRVELYQLLYMSLSYNCHTLPANHSQPEDRVAYIHLRVSIFTIIMFLQGTPQSWRRIIPAHNHFYQLKASFVPNFVNIEKFSKLLLFGHPVCLRRRRLVTTKDL